MLRSAACPRSARAVRVGTVSLTVEPVTLVSMSNASTTPLLTDQALLIALANTGHDGPDELADAVAFGRWWVRLEQEPATDAEGPGLDAVRAARDLIRALTLRNNGVEADLEAGALGRLPLHLVLDGGPDLAATGVPD